MSVLFKALQKAEKENEQRQSAMSAGADTSRLAGSGAIKSARGGKMRWAAIAGTAVLGAGIIAGVLFLSPEPPARPQVATLTPPRVSAPPTSPPPAAVPAAAAPSAVAPAAAPPANTPPAAAPAATQAEPVVAAAAPAAPPSQSTAPAPEAPVGATPAAPADKAAETPPQAVAVAPAPVASAPRAPASPAAPATKAPPRDPPAQLANDSPAQALNPPIAISRADFALSGVGNAVQVREVSKTAQSNVSSGYSALLRGDYDTALGFYDQALKSEPSSVLAMLGRGASLQKLRKFDEAQAAYDQVLKIDPANREALTNVTAIVGERAPAEALNRLVELEKTNQTFSPIKAQIGLIYAKTGNMEQALDYLRRATALNPESAMYQYNLALVLDHMGLREQAMNAYQEVLSSISIGRAPPELSANDIERRLRYLRVK